MKTLTTTETLNKLFSLLEKHNFHNFYLNYFNKSALNKPWYKIKSFFGIISRTQTEQDKINLIESFTNAYCLSKEFKTKVSDVLNKTRYTNKSKKAL